MNVVAGRAHARLAYFEILSELTRKELRVRYRNSVLGYVWSVLNPLLMAGVFYLAFGLILKAAVEHYALFLVVGLFPWQWLTNSVGTSANAYIGNASLVKKINFRVVAAALELHDLALHRRASSDVGLALGKAYRCTRRCRGVPVLVIAQFGINHGLSLAAAPIHSFAMSSARRHR